MLVIARHDSHPSKRLPTTISSPHTNGRASHHPAQPPSVCKRPYGLFAHRDPFPHNRSSLAVTPTLLLGFFVNSQHALHSGRAQKPRRMCTHAPQHPFSMNGLVVARHDPFMRPCGSRSPMQTSRRARRRPQPSVMITPVLVMSWHMSAGGNEMVNGRVLMGELRIWLW